MMVYEVDARLSISKRGKISIKESLNSANQVSGDEL